MARRKYSVWVVSVGMAALLAATAGIQAQTPKTPNLPHIAYAYPAGARQGSSVVVTVGGQFLGSTTGVHVSGDGVRATLVSLFRPLGNKEALQFRDRLKEARERLIAAGQRPGPLREDNAVGMAMLAKEAGMTQTEVYALMEFARVKKDPKIQLNPQLAERATLQVDVDPGATLGVHEIRLITRTGLTNFVRFVVGDMPEMVEKKPGTNDPIPIGSQLPVVLDGQILPGDTDRYTFHGQKGMSLVAECEAEELMPYLADTVPGWFQPAIELQDAQGHQVSYADHFLFHPDPAIKCVLPADGDYTLVIHDALYRGREDFVYRLCLGEIPLIESIYPLGGAAGAPATVSVSGWNLPRSSTAVDTSGQPGIRLVSVRGVGTESNSMPFVASELPEAIGNEHDDRPILAQSVSLPVIVNGRINAPGDMGVYRFDARAGETVVAEVLARRLESPLDSVIKLTDHTGHILAMNDDFVDKGAGLVTHQADSYLMTKLPANGSYTLTIWDAQHKGGPDYAYRLRLSEPRPDFDLRITQSAINVRAGGSTTFDVVAIRRDGFAGDITLALKGAPPGMTISGGLIPAKSDTVTVTLMAPPYKLVEPVALILEGTSSVNGQSLRREAIPADDMEQAFAYHHLVPASEWLVSVYAGNQRAPASTRLAKPSKKIK